MRLYHFTCDHHIAEIRECGELRPSLHPVLGERLVWLTPLANAKPGALGLSRGRKGRILQCDRMAHRVTVDTDDAVPWMEYRARFTPQILEMLEGARGPRPEMWWVTTGPVAVTEEGDKG